MDRDTAAILARHALFRRLSQSDKAKLLSLCNVEDMGANTIIYQEDSQGDSLYVVIRGSVLLQRDLDGDPVPFFQLQPGESFGEIAILSPGPRLLTAKALETVTVARFSQATLEKFEEASPTGASHVRTRILDHFLIKVRHLQPLWEALLAEGLREFDGEILSRR